MLVVKQIQAEDCRVLRHLVLWPHLSSPDECTIDIDDSEGAFHLGVFSGDKLVGIASFFVQKNPQFSEEKQYRLRAMATHPDYRRVGIAKAIMEFAFKKLKSEGQTLLWCDARIVAIDFYKSLGMSVLGNQFEIPMIGYHFLMYKIVNTEK